MCGSARGTCQTSPLWSRFLCQGTQVAQSGNLCHPAFFDNPAEVPYLGGECYTDVLARARPAFDELVARHPGQTIVIVTHNVVNRVLVADCLGLPLERAKFLHQSNCCFNEILCRPGITDVRSVNCDQHVWKWTSGGGVGR